MPPSDMSFRLRQIESPFPRYQAEGRERGHFHQLDQEGIAKEGDSSRDIASNLFPTIVLLADSGGISDIRVTNDEHMSGSEARIEISVSSKILTRSQ